MRILITGSGGPAAISVWKSLHREHTLFMADMDPLATGLFLVGTPERVILPRGDAPEFPEAALAACIEKRVQACISTVDAELVPLAGYNGRFTSRGIALAIGADQATLRVCRDKSLLLERMAKEGVPVPRTLLWTGRERVNEFPAFAKPRFGSGSRGLRVIKGAEDLAALPLDGEYLVQELLPGEEFSVDVYAQPRATGSVQAIAAVVRERMKTDSGIAITARTRHDSVLQNLAVKVVEVLGLAYVSNVQFKRAADGSYKFLEVNPRFPGSLPLTALAGIDMPKLLVSDLEGGRSYSGLLPYRETMMVRYLIEQEVAIDEYEALAQANHKELATA